MGGWLDWSLLLPHWEACANCAWAMRSVGHRTHCAVPPPGTACPAGESEFLEQYGDERVGMSPTQVQALQQALRPCLLRRMKEDVETLPEKEEVCRGRGGGGQGGWRVARCTGKRDPNVAQQ